MSCRRDLGGGFGCTTQTHAGLAAAARASPSESCLAEIELASIHPRCATSPNSCGRRSWCSPPGSGHWRDCLALAVHTSGVLGRLFAETLENSPREPARGLREAAAVLGFVGAGGLAQMLYVSLSMFRADQAATLLLAMIAIVIVVDALSAWVRRSLGRSGS